VGPFTRNWAGPLREIVHYDVSFEDLMADRLIAGSSEQVAEEILRDHAEFGADFVWFRMYWPGADVQKSLEMIKLMGDEVIPRVQERIRNTSVFDFTAPPQPVSSTATA
jgi:alkanesulfonate monooxygenase SsuD/methylene tetrahydromethanopterin reductase-like flavin-dependent oxidoreductase (luciferase family)